MAGDDKITGEGFSREDFSPDEAARHRQMFSEYGQDRPVARPFFALLRSAKTLMGIIVVCGAFGGALAWAFERGFFQ